MRTIGLSFLELRKYRRAQLARATIVAFIFLPLLYGTVYLVAFWTPYYNVSHLPAAIVNLDSPTQSQGKTIDVGKQLTSTLKDSQSFDWTVADEAAAQQGLETGKYIYVVTIPSNFSTNVASLGTTTPSLALLTLQSNDANSYLASIIGQDFASSVQASLNQSVVQQFVDTTLGGIIQIRKNLKQAANGAGELADGTSELKSGSRQLSSGASQVAAGNEKLASAANVAEGYALDAKQLSADVVSQMRKLVKQFPDSELAKLLLQGSIDVNNVVASAVGKITTAVDQIDELGAGSVELAQGAKQLAQGATQLNSGAQQLSSGLTDGVKQLPTWNNQQATNISNYSSSPTVIRQVQDNNFGTYGSGFAPYFMAMSLWVAMLVVYSLLKAVPARILLAGRVSALGASLTGFLPAFYLLLAQVVVLLAVVRFAVGIRPPLDNLGWLVLLMVVGGSAFVAIIQLLNAVFGIPGRLIALVLLMLQLCSCGGTYPIQMSPPFFQAISPFLPMTYLVKGIRHLLVNGDQTVALQCGLVLLAMAAIAFALTVTWVFTHRRVTVDSFKPVIEM